MTTPNTSLAERLAQSGTGFDRNRGDFDILNRALADTGLTAALADPDASLTLLAPTDAAFLRLAQSLGFAGSDEAGAYEAIAAALTALAANGDPIPLLRDILLYHALGESLSRPEVLGRTRLETLLPGATLSPFGTMLRDADPTAPDPRLLGGGERLGNGTLYALDQVLLPLDVPGNGNTSPLPTLAQLLAASGTGFDEDASDFDILNAALQATGLDAVLGAATQERTLLAPTDAAFLQLARDVGFEGIDEGGALQAILGALDGLSPGNAIPLLRDVLLYHLLDGQFSVAQLRTEGRFAFETLGGAELVIRGNAIRDEDPGSRDARFVPGQTDILAEDGALQAIDRVLLPFDVPVPPAAQPTLAELIDASGGNFDSNRQDFDMLRGALILANLTDLLDDAAGRFTLFAPTDFAFITLARQLGYRGNDEGEALIAIFDTLASLDDGGDPIPLLTEILSYHVTEGVLTARQIVEAEAITMLNGAEIAPFGRTLRDLDPSLPDARLIGGRSNLPAGNGLLQAIDRVLLPADVAELRGTVSQPATIEALLARSGTGFDSDSGDFDILNAALQATGLDAALADPDAALTLLAPTDAAFLHLAQALGGEAATEQEAFASIVQALAGLNAGDALGLLSDILLQHVIAGEFSRELLVANGTADPLEGVELRFRGNLILDAEPGSVVRFIIPEANQLAGNGAVHAIDGVLLPLDLDLL